MLPTIFPRLEQLHSEGAEALARLDAAAWASADPALLALCSLRIGQMLGGATAPMTGSVAIEPGKRAHLSEWDTSPLFTDAERAHLAFTEQFVTSVGDVSDADVDALLAHASPEAVRSFVAALYVIELEQRIDLVAAVVLADSEPLHG